MQAERKRLNSKILWPIILIVVGIVLYFLYSAFFGKDDTVLTSGGNTYVSQTKVGKYVDILNKENIIFNTNINSDALFNAKDFSIQILPGTNVGRTNPFLP